MIYYTPASERTLSLFKTPFDQSLSPENRWVKMAELVPWDEMAKVFFSSLSKNQGRPTVDLRVVLGALLVQHLERLTDEDTIQYIQENIYAQYFVGLSSFQIEPVFVPSLFVEIRKRLGAKGAAQLNDLIVKQARELKVVKHRRRPKDGKPPKNKGGSSSTQTEKPAEDTKKDGSSEEDNRGTLMVDATVAPVDMAYPMDAKLLAQARLKSEELIDGLFVSAHELWPIKPRTYRREARKKYLAFSKKRRKDQKSVRKAVGQQLRYVRRNIKTINAMLDQLLHQGYDIPWTALQWKQLWVIHELYRQQDIMYRDKRRRVDDRLVSLDKPMVRPIKRGKGGPKNTEFGPKINASMSEGIIRADQIDFNAFNEANYLQYITLQRVWEKIIDQQSLLLPRPRKRQTYHRKIALMGATF
ncbi:MAG TPA: transposase [Saprospiraceae bacterium]|nr:transposase [Saprospiraceae bacterium]